VRCATPDIVTYPERTKAKDCLPKIWLFRGFRIAANLLGAFAIILLIVNPSRDLTPICALLALAVALWLGPRVKPRR
jgi:hypothetical protein